jgi:hypothetical protein
VGRRRTAQKPGVSRIGRVCAHRRLRRHRSLASLRRLGPFRRVPIQSRRRYRRHRVAGVPDHDVSMIGRVGAAEGAFAATGGSCTAVCRIGPRYKRTCGQETHLSSFAMNYRDSFRIALEPGCHFSDCQRKQG